MMRRLNAALAALLVLVVALASGCQTEAPTVGNKIGLLDSVTDGQLISRYIEGLDIALIGDNELLFSDSAKIPSQTLYMFFVHAVFQDRLYDSEGWFNKSDEQYHIPLDAVTGTIGKYFAATQFDPATVTGYDPVKKEFVTRIFGGFGGGRFIKLRNKESLSADTVRLTADFYDGESFKNVAYTKVYTIEIGDTGYRYLSITKQP